MCIRLQYVRTVVIVETFPHVMLLWLLLLLLLCWNELSIDCLKIGFSLLVGEKKHRSTWACKLQMQMQTYQTIYVLELLEWYHGWTFKGFFGNDSILSKEKFHLFNWMKFMLLTSVEKLLFRSLSHLKSKLQYKCMKNDAWKMHSWLLLSYHSFDAIRIASKMLLFHHSGDCV